MKFTQYRNKSVYVALNDLSATVIYTLKKSYAKGNIFVGEFPSLLDSNDGMKVDHAVEMMEELIGEGEVGNLLKVPFTTKQQMDAELKKLGVFSI